MMPFLGYGPHPRPASPSPQRRSRNTLVPSGFECVAHPVFLRADTDLALASVASAASAAASAERRHHAVASDRTPTTTICPSAAAAVAWDDAETLGSGGDSGAAENALKGSPDGGDRAVREVDSVCPICLGKFERPVTLTSCLHTFCHTCILGWYEHTVAVALSRGDLSAFNPERGGEDAIYNTNQSRGGRHRKPAPYRCPLCQVPGPYFLAVEPAVTSFRHGSGTPSSAKGKASPDGSNKLQPKLKFTLLGARTVFGGGGPMSGGVTVDEHGGGDERRAGGDGGGTGYPSPSMSEFRAAVRTQRTLASAAQRAEAEAEARGGGKQGSQPSSAGEKGKGAARAKGVVREKKFSSARVAQQSPAGDKGDWGGGTSRPDNGRTNSSSSSSSSSSGGGGENKSGRGSFGGGCDQDCREKSRLPSESGGRGKKSSLRDRDRDRNHGGGRRERDRNGGAPRSGDGDYVNFRDRRSAVPGTSAREGVFGDSGVRLERNNSGGSSSSTHHNYQNSDTSARRSDHEKSRKKRRKGERKKRNRDSSNNGDSRSGGGGGGSDGFVETACSKYLSGRRGRLPWEPGSMDAEDGLAFIETALERERKGLEKARQMENADKSSL